MARAAIRGRWTITSRRQQSRPDTQPDPRQEGRRVALAPVRAHHADGLPPARPRCTGDPQGRSAARKTVSVDVLPMTGRALRLSKMNNPGIWMTHDHIDPHRQPGGTTPARCWWSNTKGRREAGLLHVEGQTVDFYWIESMKKPTACMKPGLQGLRSQPAASEGQRDDASRHMMPRPAGGATRRHFLNGAIGPVEALSLALVEQPAAGGQHRRQRTENRCRRWVEHDPRIWYFTASDGDVPAEI